MLEFGGKSLEKSPQNGECFAGDVNVCERVGNVAGEVGAVVAHAFKNMLFVFFHQWVAVSWGAKVNVRKRKVT